MEAAPDQQQLDMSHCEPRSLAASSRFAAVLSTGLAAISLLMATPALGQNAPAPSSQKQRLTCVTEGQRLVCDVQQPGQAPKAITFEQKPYTGKASETIELAPVTRTALLTPELDGMLASGLLWAFYLSLPISVIVAIWRYDRRARQQTIKFVAQVATLERIWQNLQAD